jgi:hypothetical protein
MPNFMKICPVGTDLVHGGRWTGRQTDMTKLIVAFRTFAKGPKSEKINRSVGLQVYGIGQ